MNDISLWWSTVLANVRGPKDDLDLQEYKELYLKNRPPVEVAAMIDQELGTPTLDEKDHLWDSRFIQRARDISLWSKDPSTKCGAVIVSPLTHRVVGEGYNGFPQGMSDAPELYANRKVKYQRIIHCEMNAVLDAGRQSAGCTLYTWPCISCDRCSPHMIQVGIKRAVAPLPSADMYSRWGEGIEITRANYKEVGIICDELQVTTCG